MVLISNKLKRKIMAAAKDDNVMKTSNTYGQRLSEDYSKIKTQIGIDSNTTVITKKHITKLLTYLNNPKSGVGSSKSKSGGKSKRRSRRTRRTRRRNKIGGAEGQVASLIMMLPFFILSFCVLASQREDEDERYEAGSDSDSD